MFLLCLTLQKALTGRAKGKNAPHQPDEPGVQAIDTPDNKSLKVRVGDLAENNYHTRLIIHKEPGENWKASCKHIVLDSCPVALPLCTVSEAIQDVLIHNKLVFTPDTQASYFLNPVFCLRLLRFLLMQQAPTVHQAIESMKKGNETILWYDSLPTCCYCVL